MNNTMTKKDNKTRFAVMDLKSQQTPIVDSGFRRSRIISAACFVIFLTLQSVAVPKNVAVASEMIHVFLIQDSSSFYLRFLHPDLSQRLNPGVLVLAGPDTGSINYERFLVNFKKEGYSGFLIATTDYQDNSSILSGFERLSNLDATLKTIVGRLGLLRYFKKGKLGVVAVGQAAISACSLARNDENVSAIALINPVLSPDDLLVKLGKERGPLPSEEQAEIFKNFGVTLRNELDSLFKNSGPPATISHVHVPLMILETADFTAAPGHAKALSEMTSNYENFNRDKNLKCMTVQVKGKGNRPENLLTSSGLHDRLKTFFDSVLVRK